MQNGSGIYWHELIGISKDHVWKVLKKHKINFQRNHSWCISTDPEFFAQSCRYSGILPSSGNPQAVVICVDEKPAMQVLSWIRGGFNLK